MEFESDQKMCGRNVHNWGTYASTLKTAKQYIARCRKSEAAFNPRNFRIYDTWGEIDKRTGFVPCVYEED